MVDVITTVVAVIATVVAIGITVMVTVVTTIAIAIVTSVTVVTIAVASRFLSRLFSRLACYSVVIGFRLVVFCNRLFSLWCNDVGIAICDSFFSVFFCSYFNSLPEIV